MCWEPPSIPTPLPLSRPLVCLSGLFCKSLLSLELKSSYGSEFFPNKVLFPIIAGGAPNNCTSFFLYWIVCASLGRMTRTPPQISVLSAVATSSFLTRLPPLVSFFLSTSSKLRLQTQTVFPPCSTLFFAHSLCPLPGHHQLVALNVPTLINRWCVLDVFVEDFDYVIPSFFRCGACSRGAMGETLCRSEFSRFFVPLFPPDSY